MRQEVPSLSCVSSVLLEFGLSSLSGFGPLTFGEAIVARILWIFLESVTDLKSLW